MDGWQRFARWARLGADLGLAALFAVALCVQAVAVTVSWGGGYWLFGCGTGLAVCALALLRRQNRGLTAVAGLAIATVAIPIAWLAGQPSEPGPAMASGLSVLVGSAVRTLSPRWAVGVASGGFVTAAESMLATYPTLEVTTVTMLNGLGWFTALSVGLGLRLIDTRRRMALEEVRQNERTQLARELHDVVAHHVTGIVLAAQAARLTARKQPERLDDSLADIETAGSDAMAAMRRLVGLLRDTEDGPATFPEQLGELVERFNQRGRTVRLLLPDEPIWTPEIGNTIHRIVQESLTNVVRHALPADSVTVGITQDTWTTTVEVADDAPATRARRSNGYGLVGMRERVLALGGTLEAGPCPNGGWLVRATLPRVVPERR